MDDTQLESPVKHTLSFGFAWHMCAAIGVLERGIQVWTDWTKMNEKGSGKIEKECLKSLAQKIEYTISANLLP